MSRHPLPRRASIAGVALLAAVGVACTENAPGDADGGAIAVTSTADECTVAATEAPSGNLVFEVTNDGSEVTEFYLLGDDGLRIVGEVENIGPGTHPQPRGARHPGLVPHRLQAGHGRRRHPRPVHRHRLRRGARRRRRHRRAAHHGDRPVPAVRRRPGRSAGGEDPSSPSCTRTGDDDAARALYADARTHWERIEPVAESFGDLDPKLDLREADLAEGRGVDRLAPHREGPVAAGRGLHRR
jgi:iron uptake system component EfeO